MDLADDSDQAATPDLEQALILAGVVGMIDPPRVQAALAIADDNSATIVQAVREGRSIFDNIRNFLRCWLSSNMGEVLTVFLGMIGASVIGFGSGDLTGGNANAHAVVLPLLATQLLWINLVTDLGPALALGKDPPVGDLMARPPRHQTERLTDGRMWRDVFAVGLVTAALTLITMDIQLPGGLIEDSQSLTTARTAGFTVPVLASLFNCVCARSDTASAFRHSFANHWLWAAIELSALLQTAVVRLPWLDVAFGTASPSSPQWATCVVKASGVLWFSELRKAVGHVGASDKQKS